MDNKDISLFDSDDLEKIEMLAMFGLPQEKISSFFRMSKSKFMYHVNKSEKARAALDRGYAKAEKEVSKVAYEMATSGKNTAATMFWLKCRAGWKETQVQEIKKTTVEDLVNGAAKKEEQPGENVIPIEKKVK